MSGSASVLLVQLQEYVPASIFTQYAYFSSYADSWLAHARDYMDAVVDASGSVPDHQVIELRQQDGYLLHILLDRGIPGALGVEPAANVADGRP